LITAVRKINTLATITVATTNTLTTADKGALEDQLFRITVATGAATNASCATTKETVATVETEGSNKRGLSINIYMMKEAAVRRPFLMSEPGFKGFYGFHDF
jgi:hypothetical protein